MTETWIEKKMPCLKVLKGIRKEKYDFKRQKHQKQTNRKRAEKGFLFGQIRREKGRKLSSFVKLCVISQKIYVQATFFV